MRIRFAPIVAAVVAVTCLSGCTPGATPGTAPPGSTGSVKSTPTIASTRSVSLGCRAPGTAPKKLHKSWPRGIQVGGRTLTDLTTPISATPLPRATDVNLRPPPGMGDWYFLKAPIVLLAGAGPITLSLTPDANQRLAWVRGDVWTSGQPPNLTDWATTNLTLTGCPGRDVTYFGGILTKAGSGCAQLHVDSRSKPAAVFSWSFGISHCTSNR